MKNKLIHFAIPPHQWPLIEIPEDALVLVAVNQCPSSKDYAKKAKAARAEFGKRQHRLCELLVDETASDTELLEAYAMMESYDISADANSMASEWAKEWEAQWIGFSPYAASPFDHDRVQRLGYDAITDRDGYCIWRGVNLD